MEPDFPDVYVDYLKLLITLKMHKTVTSVATKALEVAGVDQAHIYENLGLYAESLQNFELAKKHYKKAALLSAVEKDYDSLQQHLKRVRTKEQLNQNMVYSYEGS